MPAGRKGTGGFRALARLDSAPERSIGVFGLETKPWRCPNSLLEGGRWYPGCERAGDWLGIIGCERFALRYCVGFVVSPLRLSRDDLVFRLRRLGVDGAAACDDGVEGVGIADNDDWAECPPTRDCERRYPGTGPPVSETDSRVVRGRSLPDRSRP